MPLPEPFYYPLGALEYASEIEGSFADEATLIGVITILWNRQELALRRLFVELAASPRKAFMEAIWDRQPTHQSRRELLGLALITAPLSKRQKAILDWIIDNTKTLADRRNELMHAEYVVEVRKDKLHAKVKSPRSTKPPKHQPLAVSDLRVIVTNMERLLQATEAASLELMTPRKKRRLDMLISELERLGSRE